MTTCLTPDICVIGGGSGGLSVAAAAAAFGVPVVLIERDKMGGDCLNTGCVPSKAMLAAGRRAEVFRSSTDFGIASVNPDIDFTAVHKHVHDVIATIAPHDSVERFEGLGVKVIKAEARFLDRLSVQAGDYVIKARRFVVATGSSASVPPIKGLDSVDFLTNETLFTLTKRPEHLLVIGGGPIGLEMAQAHKRLGSKVDVFEAFKPLANDDPELTGPLIEHLISEGISIHSPAMIEAINQKDMRITVQFNIQGQDETKTITGSHILVAAGRKPNIDGLGLEKAGVEIKNGRISVNQSLRTHNKKIYAIGDVVGGLQFTHVAGYQAGLIIRALLFRLPVKFKPEFMPWCTYTEPELSSVGLSEAKARQQYGDRIKVLVAPFSGNDRAIAERVHTGKVKLIAGPSGQLLGATILGHGAGDMIALLSLAQAKKMKIRDLAGFIAPYPTLSEAIRRAAVSYYAPVAQSKSIRRIIGFLRRFG